ncbi:MAG: chemotaxis protein CheA [Alphaproteobacteria bacterium]|nr:chemotaxis protein CheA [Alphaproteobacteria bacterium]
MDPTDRFKRTYFEECGDLLSSAEARLMSLGDDPQDGEAMAGLFRAVHSIKGGAGAFGLDRLVKFAHEFETVLDGFRSGKASLDLESHATLLRALDTLADLVQADRSGLVLLDNHEAAAAAELAALKSSLGLQRSGASPRSAGPGRVAEIEPRQKRRWRVRFTPSRDLLRKANEPLLLLRELRTLGAVKVAVDTSAIPDLASIEPDGMYLCWVLEVETAENEERICEVFEFVADDCEIAIEPLPPTSADGPEEPLPAAATALARATETDRAAQGAIAPVSGEQSTIRVDIEKIDRLVNMVGEILITQAMLSQQVAAVQGDVVPELAAGLSQMAAHARELQENVMSIRAQPVKSVFQRMPRLVRELSAQLGKEARVLMSGEDTEVDKTVIEQLSDPLVHMVRNALDHGIEMPDARVTAGKPRTGTILLSARHRGGRIVIEVEDDGAGIDRRRVLEKCVARGLVAPGAAPSDEEIDNFIFLPGFSTASKVSDISGRGVGMDVVKRNIQALGGRVHIDSKPGRGSRFTLSLPLTLAVLDGMIVTLGVERYIVPLASIVESLRPLPRDVARLAGSGRVMALRGEYIRLVYLAQVFGCADAVNDPCRGLVVVAEVENGLKVGLVVDEILGQQQVVIKSLETNYRQIDGISAATILGDGRVALILDLAGLGRVAEAADAAPTAPAALPPPTGSSPAVAQ